MLFLEMGFDPFLIEDRIILATTLASLVFENKAGHGLPFALRVFDASCGARIYVSQFVVFVGRELAAGANPVHGYC